MEENRFSGAKTEKIWSEENMIGSGNYTMCETGDMNCYEFYLEATKQYGDYDAVQHMDLRVKRSQFIDDIESLAAYFYSELGLRRGDVYTIFCPTNVESLVGFYALNKLGVIVSFVHPLLPTEMLKEYVESAHSKGVMILDLLSKDHVKTLNKLGVPVLLCRNSDYAAPVKKYATRAGEGILEAIFPKFKNCVSYSAAIKRHRGERVQGVTNNSSDIAVYLNGGGTTGKSKTIMLTNKNVNEVPYKTAYIDEIHEPGEEAEIIILPFFHAFGLCLAAHMALCNAARVIPLMKFNAKLVIKLYKKNKIIALVGIPNMFKKLYHTEGFDGPHLSNTRMMFVGGDDLSPKFLQDFNDMLERNGTSARLRQGYGLTEVCAPCCANTNWVNKDGSIGKPFEGVRMEIWDDNCNRVPNGEVGEICVTGSTVMAGYYDGTGERGIGLYYDKEGTPWVRSGDLGYQDDDGFFFFAGRKKRLIIISGYNVYPVDIENLMDTLPFVRESCAVRGEKDGRPLVRLYVSLKEKGLDQDELREKIIKTCEDNLDKFSVPREVIFMDELPHTPLEKVDFMALEKMAV